MKKVEIGSTILVQFDDGEKETFEIVEPSGANVEEKKISADSLFGRAVIETIEGSSIQYQNSAGKPVRCKVIKVC